MVYQRRLGGVPVWVPTWYDRKGRPLGKIGPEDATRGLGLSPDGQRLVLLTGRGQDEVRVMRVDGTGSRTLAAADGVSDPYWSPDGRSLYYLSLSEQGRALVRQDANGATPAETLLRFTSQQGPRLAAISPSGRTALLFLDITTHNGHRMDRRSWRLPPISRSAFCRSCGVTGRRCWKPRRTDQARILLKTSAMVCTSASAAARSGCSLLTL